LLPIFSNFIQRTVKRGTSILYITPLRALNRDMFERLSFWASKLDITIEVRHGDTEAKFRRRQALFPPNMLVTTPETLQAILPGALMKRHLTHVKCVIIDEVHELASSKRGVQLTAALERLYEITGKEFQRIGLSATVAEPEKIAKFITGTPRSVKVVEATSPKDYRYMVENPAPEKADYELAAELRTSPEAAARIRRIMELVDSHKSTLIFVNSRQNAEMLGHKFSQLDRSDIAVHHGSLSKEERAIIEDDFKAGTLKAIICTSTLELGIDIGDVDLVIQYFSPRQVSSLIQRVGRSGHRLDKLSQGVIITAFSDDTLESVAAVRSTNEGKLEPVIIHENALDVLAHQVAGIVLDKGKIKSEALLTILRRTFAYRDLTEEKLLDVIDYLDWLNELRFEKEENVVRKTRKTWRYYYENLSMIPDERRYPIVNVITDRKIGTLGDEFMALKVRVGLNFICRGLVWRIVQIEDETGTVYVVPSQDPLAAIPGWDGEMLPVTFNLAQETGRMRERIAKELKKTGGLDKIKGNLVDELAVEDSTLEKVAEEIWEYVKESLPLPSHDHIVVEGFSKYVIVHTCFGEIINRTLGCIFDAILSDRELIVGWWNDGYRILLEEPRKIDLKELRKLSETLFNLSIADVQNYFDQYLETRFPFSYKMKAVAERFGALPRGKTILNMKRMRQLSEQFRKTPIFDETLREAMVEKVDINMAKKIMEEIRNGKIKVNVLHRIEKPTPLAYHILAKYSDISEFMAPESVLLSNIDRMEKTIDARRATLLCFSCSEWIEEYRIGDLSDNPGCGNCGARLLALVRFGQDANELRDILDKRLKNKELTEEELKDLTYARRTADLILSYGKKAIIALEVRGIGPETAFRILGKMHREKESFYLDLLKAKIQYLRTRAYWETEED
ncbi:MAG: DEAD/DEAH box helicase, partial [Candidatus Bathyarchaeota archaeon]